MAVLVQEDWEGKNGVYPIHQNIFGFSGKLDSTEKGSLSGNCNNQV